MMRCFWKLPVALKGTLIEDQRMMPSLQPYQSLRQVAQDLYCVDGEWFETAFRRRMTVVRLKDGSLVIHSAIQMAEKDLRDLDRLGPVGTIVVPNVFHGSEASFYAERYPQAKVFMPAKIEKKCSARMRVSGTLEKDWPHQAELPCISFANNLAAESVFVHRVSRTLIVTDMAFNVVSSDFKSSLERLVFGKWNGILDQLGPSRLTKYVVARDRKSLKVSLEQIAAQDFDRVIVNHGRIIEEEGKRKFLEGYRRIYGEL